MRRKISGPQIAEKFEENREEIESVFEELEGIELAYLFGSMVEGGVGKLSDIDFAVYLSEEAAESSLDKEIEIYKKLSGLVGEEMDIVVMNNSSKLMNYNIVKNGELLYKSSDSVKVNFESDVMRKYLDMKYYQDRHVEQRLRKFAEKGLA